MRKLLSLFICFILLFSILGCKRSLVEHITFPLETELKLPQSLDINNARVDITANISETKKVFGGFGKRFEYMKEWYVLADYMYEYYEASQRKIEIATNIIIRMKKDAIEVYALNLSYDFKKTSYSVINGSEDILNASYSSSVLTNWVLLDGIYYFIKYYELAAPTNDISNLVYKYDTTSFSLKEKDIKNANQYRLCVSHLEPKIGIDEYQSLKVLNPIFSTFAWMGGSDFVFYIEGKIIRLVDYEKPDLTLDYPFILNAKKDERDIWYEKAFEGGYTNYYEEYTKTDCYYNAMINDAWSQIYELYVANIMYFMPSKAVTHYSIDIRY